MNQEKDNAKNASREKSNLYAIFEVKTCQNRSIRLTNVKEKCLQDHVYKANNTHPEVNKSNIDRNFGKIRGATEYKS
jgi:hypothetical protein